jgi:hypothetical protein
MEFGIYYLPWLEIKMKRHAKVQLHADSANSEAQQTAKRNPLSKAIQAILHLRKIDTAIWTALFGLIGTFIASPIAMQIFNQLKLPEISDKRRQALEGRWEGFGMQELSKEDKQALGKTNSILRFPAHLVLDVEGRTIKGTLELITYTFDSENQIEKQEPHGSKAIEDRSMPDASISQQAANRNSSAKANDLGNSKGSNGLAIEHMDHVTKHKEITYNLSGHMVANDYIRLDYVSSDPAVIEFGTLLLKLAPVGSELKGKYVSYGPITERLVKGEYIFNIDR